MTKIKAGQRLTSKFDGSRAEVVKVSKDGKKVYVEVWSGNTAPKLMRLWQNVSAFVEGGR